MTKFYTDKKKRVRLLSNRTTTIGSYQTGTAHLSVPKKIQVKQKTIIRVFYDDRDAMITAMRVLSDKSPNTNISDTMMDQLNWLDVDNKQAVKILEKWDSEYPFSHITSKQVISQPKKHLNKSSLQPLLTNYSQRSVNGNLYRVTRFRGNRNSYRILVDVTKFHNGSKPDYDLKIEKDGKEVLVKSYGTEEELLNTLQEYTK